LAGRRDGAGGLLDRGGETKGEEGHKHGLWAGKAFFLSQGFILTLMGLLAIVAGLVLLPPSNVLVCRSEKGILIVGTTEQRRVVVLVTSDTMLTVNGPRQGAAAALFARANGRVPESASAAGQTWIKPPAVRGDRLKGLSTWVQEELGVTEEPQTVDPSSLPGGSFEPESYLAPGDLVQAAGAGGQAILRFDPEGGPLENQARRQRAVDDVLKRKHDDSPLRRFESPNGDKVFLLTFGQSDSVESRTLEVLLRSAPVKSLLASRAEVLTLRSRESEATPGADALLRALLPKGPVEVPAWAVMDAAGRVLATSVAYPDGRPLKHGPPSANVASASYFVRQLTRTLPKMGEAEERVLMQATHVGS
jgi:hypothetical protein